MSKRLKGHKAESKKCADTSLTLAICVMPRRTLGLRVTSLRDKTYTCIAHSTSQAKRKKQQIQKVAGPSNARIKNKVASLNNACALTTSACTCAKCVHYLGRQLCVARLLVQIKHA